MDFKRFLLENDEQYGQVVRAINFLNYQFPDVDIELAPVDSLAKLLSAEQLIPQGVYPHRFVSMMKQVVKNGKPTTGVPREKMDHVIFDKLRKFYPKLNIQAASERLISQIIAMHEWIPKGSNPTLAARMVKGIAGGR